MKRLPLRMKRIALLVLTFLVSTDFSQGIDISMDAQPESEMVKRSPTIKCGLRPYDSQPKVESRILNGEQASYGEFPWHVSISELMRGLDGKVIREVTCGASIINEFWLLSVAHCLDQPPKTYEVIAGNHDLRKRDHAEQIFQVENIVKHENHKGKSGDKDYDIALIKIKQSAKGRGIQFNSYAQPVCLPDATTSYTEGTKCLVSGWGKTKVRSYNRKRGVLMKTELQLVDRKKCQQSYARRITERMLCAGDLRGHTGTCTGDSGGGLVYKDRDAYTVLGIVSWGDPKCSVPIKPGLFTDVLSMLPWINTTMKLYSGIYESMLPSRP